ncbi:transglycosylase [Staphylococcus coagulans]|uniref:transglycosylase n=1 Tax=Staphylococcus coagulans TaxID=74706 RepID=UPI003364B7DC
MKKTLLASSLALALGTTGVALNSADANAAEENINKAELAQLALNNDQSLNEHAIEDGAYDYHFTVNGVNFHFWSDGVTFGWSYGYGSGQEMTQSSMAQPTQMADYSAQASAHHGNNEASNVQQSNYSAPAKQSAPSYQTASTSTNNAGSVTLSNGNTAGNQGSRAAQILAQRTGVSASTWEHIIARESNGQLNARNASGASGLFQTMPGWGPTNTFDQQVDAATKAYKAQGLSAWGM